MNGIVDNDDEYLIDVDFNDEDLIDEAYVESGFGYGKNYDMIRQLILDAGSNYIKEDGLTKIQYYLNNLVRIDSLKSFVDEHNAGILWEACFILVDDSIKNEAILRYIVNHKNVAFHQINVVPAAARSEYTFFKLIEAGASVDQKFNKTNCSALHLAALCKRKNTAKYILNETVNVNVCNWRSCTALHYAFKTNNNLDIIELLIQKGVDLYWRNEEFLTPLEFAITIKQFDNVLLVLNSEVTGNIVTFDLLMEVFSSFCQLYSENSELFQNDYFSWSKPQEIIDYYEFFKLLYKKLIQYFIANNNTTDFPVPILSIYLDNNVFESKDWANALTVILKSEIAPMLLEECLSYEKQSIFSLLIPKLVRAEVEQEDRMNLLKLLLSMKMVPNLKDMALILTHYRLKEEFQLLNFSLPDDCLLDGYNRENSMEYIASVFCGLENDLDYNKIFGEELPENSYDYIKQYFTPALSNCSFNSYYRNSETNLPKILSLRELSRNSARKLIKRYTILSPRDFNSVVDSLPIPRKCKNYISLKSKVDEFHR